ncbi:hypothetical protein GOP47_0001861 [Adiantum capillus-veneris]|uniref:Uncharacterized protein n=1 Tax=Adiantum capillus-veneris TaxID=13818 RepID=A0A9D4ZNH5_ADICA|nr:hypothetical protein GOP47_0001861 [Adiantum capillus-veneris]
MYRKQGFLLRDVMNVYQDAMGGYPTIWFSRQQPLSARPSWIVIYHHVQRYAATVSNQETIACRLVLETSSAKYRKHQGCARWRKIGTWKGPTLAPISNFIEAL